MLPLAQSLEIVRHSIGDALSLSLARNGDLVVNLAVPVDHE